MQKKKVAISFISDNEIIDQIGISRRICQSEEPFTAKMISSSSFFFVSIELRDARKFIYPRF